MSEPILSECGCNACHSGPSEYCENGPYWHERCDRLTQALAEAEAALEGAFVKLVGRELAQEVKRNGWAWPDSAPPVVSAVTENMRQALTRIRAAKGGE